MTADHRGVLARPGRPLRWAAVVIFVFALVAVALAAVGRARQVDAITGESLFRARGAAADVDRFVQSQLRTLAAIAEAPVVKTGDLAQVKTYFDDLDPASLGLDAGVSWLDERGWMQVRSGDYRGPPIDFSDREHVRRALATQDAAVSSGVVGVVNDSPLVALVVPVTRPDGTFGGLVAAGIRLDNLSLGADSLRYAGGADIVVIDANGMVIAGPAPVTELKATDPAFPVAELREAGQGAREVQVGPLGEADQLLGHAVAEQTGWLVLVERSAAGAFGAVNRAFIAALLAILGGAALSIGLLVWAARRLDVAVREQSRAYAHEQLARRQLEEAVTRLKERATLRDAFVGVMSHELRTPVTTIYGAAKLLAKAPHRDDLETLVEDIDEEATRLLRITEDLLVLARAEHGTIEIEREPILVQRIVPRVVADVRSRYPAMEITVEVGEEPPAAGDPGAVHQVLNNLLVNAVKYAAGAPIRVRTTSADGRVGFIVEDEGPGLPPADLPHVFQLFFRSQQNANRTAGTGIGLFVVQQLVEAMGGSVRAYRREPRGLGFEVLLPAYDAGR